MNVVIVLVRIDARKQFKIVLEQVALVTVNSVLNDLKLVLHVQCWQGPSEVEHVLLDIGKDAISWPFDLGRKRSSIELGYR